MTLPETIKYSMQPYTHGAVVGDLEWHTYVEKVNGETRHYKTLRGKIISGTETSFLCGHRSTKNIEGQTVTIYGVEDGELARGEIVRMAM